MNHPLIRVSVCLALWGYGVSTLSAEEPACPVTNPATSIVEVPWNERDHLEGNRLWYGTKSLAVLLSTDGDWGGMGAEDNYGNKLWFWSGYWVLEDEPQPDLKVHAKELYDETLTSEIDSTTHGFGDYWEAMLTGLGFPAAGCWQITAEYRNTTLLFVVMVQDQINTQ